MTVTIPIANRYPERCEFLQLTVLGCFLIHTSQCRVSYNYFHTDNENITTVYVLAYIYHAQNVRVHV